MLEHERRYPKLLGLELLKNVLGVVGAVVAAYSRMVAPHYKVGAAVVFAAEGVEDRLPRSRVAHSRREDRQDGTLLGVVAPEDDLVGAHPDCGRDVVRLGLADQGVEEEAVHGLKGALLDVLVGAVDGVTGLKAHHALPALLDERCSQLSRFVVVAGEGTAVGGLYELHLTPEQYLSLPVKRGYARVLSIRGPVDHLSLALLIVTVALPEQHSGYRLPVAVRQGYFGPFIECSGRLFIGGERYGQTPDQSVREAHLFDDALVLLPEHKALQRTEDPGGDHLQVGDGPRT